jgi:hypothetical protein
VEVAVAVGLGVALDEADGEGFAASSAELIASPFDFLVAFDVGLLVAVVVGATETDGEVVAVAVGCGEYGPTWST